MKRPSLVDVILLILVALSIAVNCTFLVQGVPFLIEPDGPNPIPRAALSAAWYIECLTDYPSRTWASPVDFRQLRLRELP